MLGLDRRACETSGFVPRRRINLSLPPVDLGETLTGFEPANLAVYASHDIGAVVIVVPAADVELVLSPHSAIDVVLKLVGSLNRLQSGDGA
jgi:hypothetical protein